jgi:DNA-binding NarL/FixJ family response regulator
MSNTCTICRDKERERVEDALACGLSLRDIARQFETSKDAVRRHQTCIAASYKP